MSAPVLAAATSYYSKTSMYFLVPSDATFQIAMPADYTSFTAITGTAEGSATATNWISFNFTTIPQATLQEPQQLGVAANIQNHVAKLPIIYLDNTGNVNEKIELKLVGNLPTGVQAYFNATGGGTPTAALTLMTTGYQTVEASMTNAQFLNITLFANTSATVVAGQSTQDFYLKSTAV
jgi:hypothetical protein